MKKFTIMCTFSGSTAPVSFYIQDPHPEKHPIFFQQKWLSDTKGGVVPQDIIDALQKLKELAEKNGTVFEELAYYAMTVSNKK